MMAEVFPGPVVNLGVDILVGAAEVQDVVVILFFFNLPFIYVIFLEKEMATTSVFLPGKFRGQRSLANYSPWGHKESATTE